MRSRAAANDAVFRNGILERRSRSLVEKLPHVGLGLLSCDMFEGNFTLCEASERKDRVLTTVALKIEENDGVHYAGDIAASGK